MTPFRFLLTDAEQRQVEAATRRPPLPRCANGDGRDGVVFGPTDSRSERPICVSCWMALDRRVS